MYAGIVKSERHSETPFTANVPNMLTTTVLFCNDIFEKHFFIIYISLSLSIWFSFSMYNFHKIHRITSFTADILCVLRYLFFLKISTSLIATFKPLYPVRSPFYLFYRKITAFFQHHLFRYPLSLSCIHRNQISMT